MPASTRVSPCDRRPAGRVRPLALAIAGVLTWLCTAPVQAHIFCCGDNLNTTESGLQTELVFVAWDGNGASPKVSFVKDLGLTMGGFFVSGQQDTGSSRYTWLGGTGTSAPDPVWTSFLNTDLGGGTVVDPSKVRWAVVAYDTRGSQEVAELNLFTTLAQGVSGSADVILGLSDYNNNQLDDSRTSYERWLGAVNNMGVNTGVTDAAVNNSLVVKLTDGDAFAFNPGSPGNSSGEFNYNGNLQRSAGNLMGQSSWFYYVTSSTPFDSTALVTIDEFDNAAHDGYWGLALSTDPAHPGEYLLSYTLDAVTSPTEQAAGVVFGNSFARIAGIYSLASPAGKARATLTLTENFLRGLSRDRALASQAPAQRALGVADLAGSLSPVPEPTTSALWLAGMAAAGLARARRRRA